ncbi:MAG TPA: hypothetical protein GXZ47_09530 [Treponema sp.]|nr:hypothetical protein [Treponema sp.]
MKFFGDPSPNKKAIFDTKIDFNSITILEKAYAFLELKGLSKSSLFYKFPIETCFVSSWFLASYFTSIKYEALQWIFGNSEKYGGHVWLESKDYTIDFTYSQFEPISTKFLFYKNTSAKPYFHDHFTIVDKGYFGDSFEKNKKHPLILQMVDEFQKTLSTK